MDDGPSVSGARPGPGASLALLLAIAALLRVAQIDVAAQVDEVYHVLAALSWLEDGSFAVGGGSYTRTPSFTVIVAGALELFGDSLPAARIPALVFGLAWVGLVFEWTRRAVGPGAAWPAGLLFAFDPGAIHLSQFARFYTLHGLLFWTGAVSAWWIVDGDLAPGRARVAAVLAAAALALAYRLQPAAGLGAAALVLWAAGRWVGSAAGDPTRVRNRVLLLAAVAAAAAGAAVATGIGPELWASFRTAADWAAYRADQWRFYHWWLEGRFPVLWRLYPLAVLWSVRSRRRVGVFAAVMFAVPLLLHSFAGPKDERYLYYALPFFFVTWGIVLVDAIGGASTAARNVWERLAPLLPGGSRARRALTAVTVVAVLAFPVYTSPAFKTTVGMVAGDGPGRPYGQPRWREAAPELRRRAEGKEVVVASRAVKALYYLGRVDAEVIVAPPVSWALRRTAGFEIDERIGRPVLHTRRGLSAFLRCHESGLVVIERARWEGLRTEKGGALADLVRDATEPLPAPDRWGLEVRGWTARTGTGARGCAAVRALTGRAAAGR